MPVSALDWVQYLLPVIVSQLTPVLTNYLQRYISSMSGPTKGIVNTVGTALVSALTALGFGSIDPMVASTVGASLAAASHVAHNSVPVPKKES